MYSPKVVETIADIAYIAGANKFFSGDSRLDISEFIRWAQDFENINSSTNWDEKDYISAIEEFTMTKLTSL
jgi:hypothetical protein